MTKCKDCRKKISCFRRRCQFCRIAKKTGKLTKPSRNRQRTTVTTHSTSTSASRRQPRDDYVYDPAAVDAVVTTTHNVAVATPYHAWPSETGGDCGSYGGGGDGGGYDGGSYGGDCGGGDYGGGGGGGCD